MSRRGIYLGGSTLIRTRSHLPISKAPRGARIGALARGAEEAARNFDTTPGLIRKDQISENKTASAKMSSKSRKLMRQQQREEERRLKLEKHRQEYENRKKRRPPRTQSSEMEQSRMEQVEIVRKKLEPRRKR